MAIAKNGTEYIETRIGRDEAIAAGSIDVNIAMPLGEIADADGYDAFLDVLNDWTCEALLSDICIGVVDVTNDGQIVLNVSAEVYDED